MNKLGNENLFVIYCGMYTVKQATYLQKLQVELCAQQIVLDIKHVIKIMVERAKW